MRVALQAAHVAPHEVDTIVTVSSTGVAVPTIDARIASRLGLRPDVKRIPLFGLGCVAGAAGMARVHDYLCGFPSDVAVLLSVELCSLTLQRDDTSIPALIGACLFGDGAAAGYRNRPHSVGTRGVYQEGRNEEPCARACSSVGNTKCRSTPSVPPVRGQSSTGSPRRDPACTASHAGRRAGA